MKALLASLVLLAGMNAMADHHEGDKDRPCKEIKEACEAAGFKKGAHKEGKGLWMDCMQKLKAGESVPGVTISADKLAACKAKAEEHAEHKTTK